MNKTILKVEGAPIVEDSQGVCIVFPHSGEEIISRNRKISMIENGELSMLEKFREIVGDVVDLYSYIPGTKFSVAITFAGDHATLVIRKDRATGSLHLTVLRYDDHLDMYTEEKEFPPVMGQAYLEDKIEILHHGNRLYNAINIRYRRYLERSRERLQESE